MAPAAPEWYSKGRSLRRRRALCVLCAYRRGACFYPLKPAGAALSKSLSAPLAAAFLLLLLSAAAPAGGSESDAASPAPKSAAAASPEPESEAGAAEDGAERTELNLLGEVDSGKGESRRNENVQLTLIDNNVLKELNMRMGVTATVVDEFQADKGYFGAEFGGPPNRQIHLTPSLSPGIHGSVYESHNNSLFSARSFFQVGGVQPARTNDYGFSLTAPLRRTGTAFTVDANRQRIRGNVNGNVLVPKLDERTPLATDPELRAFVGKILGSFPEVAPNRTDINPRALNTNATQKIDNDTFGGRLDQALGNADRLIATYRFKKQKVDAFQLVAGQNPNTTTGSHEGRLTWNRSWSPQTTVDFTAGFQRITSLIVQDETAFGPLIFSGRQLQTLGGSSSLPYDRAQNQYRYAGMARTVRGNHELTAGFAVNREQLNGAEGSGHLGLFMFNSNFGRDTITNLRMGTPSRYSRAFGDTHRGFRRWKLQAFVGDAWKAARKLTLSFGLRFEPVTRPIEVNGLAELPYACDCNNFAPRFGFAYRLNDWAVLRGAYGLHYGEIFPATYTQQRFNPPANIRVSVVAPDVLNPTKDISLDPGARSTIVAFSPDLVAPYSHQYNFGWEIAPAARWTLRMSYLGSRTHRLLTGWLFNRALPVEGVALTIPTVNIRRPDKRFFDVRRILNGSRAYYDAAKAEFVLREWNGLSMDFSYWFSKALDLGAHYASNAGVRDAFAGRSQTEFEVFGDIKAPSDFDQPHSTMWRTAYKTPRLGGAKSVWNKAFGEWETHTVVLLKRGTPFVIRSGSDGPGFGNVDGAAGDRPHIVDPSILGRSIDHPDTAPSRLPLSAFAFVQPGEPRGNLARNAFRKDGIRNVNLALSRTWNPAGETALIFRAESINFLNTAQFANPGQELSGANFGQITNTLNDGRTFRFLLRFRF